jgi:hypothetical protein
MKLAGHVVRMERYEKKMGFRRFVDSCLLQNNNNNITITITVINYNFQKYGKPTSRTKQIKTMEVEMKL